MLNSKRQIFVYIVRQHVQLVLLGQILIGQLPSCCHKYLISSFVRGLVALLIAHSVEEFIQIIALLFPGLQLVLEMSLLFHEILIRGAQLPDRDAHILDELALSVGFILDFGLELRDRLEHIVKVL